MNIESQVCSLELARRLKELGVRQESYFYHVAGYIVADKGEYYYNGKLYEYGCGCCEEVAYYDKDDVYSAFSVAEIMEILPAFINDWQLKIVKYSNSWNIDYVSDSYFLCDIDDDSLVNGLAKMLIHLIEKGHVSAGDL